MAPRSRRPRQGPEAGKAPRPRAEPASAARHPELPADTDLLTLQRLAGNFAVVSRLHTPDELRGLWFTNFSGLTEEDKLAVAEEILAATYKSGGKGPDMLHDLWKSFGDDLVPVATKNHDLWRRCAAHWARLGSLEPIEKLKKVFKRDAEALAESHLEANRETVSGEIDELTEGLEGDAEGRGRQTPEDRVRALQAAGEVLVRAEERREALAGTVVGYRDTEGGSDGSFNEDLSRSDDDTPVASAEAVYFDSSFEPADLDRGGVALWAGLKVQDDELAAVIATLLAQHPSLFAMLRSGTLAGFVASPDIEGAQATALDDLRILRDDIDEAWQTLSLGGISPLDLHPIHRQLYAGTPARSGEPWSHPFYRWAGQEAVGDHESEEFWKQLGLASASAAAFLFASFATGGLAAFFFAAGGTAVNAFQIADDYEQWSKLQLADRAHAGDENRLVDPAQVTAKEFDLALDVLGAGFDVVDAAGVGGRLIRSARAGASQTATWGMQVALEEGPDLVRRLRGLHPGAADRAQVVEGAIDLLGFDEMVRLSNRTPGQLIRLVGAETPLGMRILGLGSSKEPLFALNDLVRGTRGDGTTIDGITRNLGLDDAVERMGPVRVLAAAGGWKKLVKIVGKDSSTAQRLLRFRDETLLPDLQRFTERWLPENPLPEPVMVRTGTSGGADNDLDLSFLGPQSAHNRAQTRAYLATRLGVEPDQLKELLHCDFFVDPRRLHAYDALPADLRRAVADEQVAFEQELVLNRALHEAGERGDEAGAMMLRERMSYLGIAEDYVPLDPGDIDDLYRLVDEWSEELVFQGRSASPELVRKIGRAQSQINAVEEGGYLTGGGTRRIVTDRDLAPLLGKAPVEAVDAEAISAALDELLKVYPLIGRIEDALDAGGLVDVIKALDKHVDRFAGATSPAVWDKKALDALFETKSAVWDELWPRIAKFEEMSATAARQLAEARGTARIKLIDRLNTQKAVVIAEARRTVEILLEIQWRLIDDLRGRCNLEGALGNTGLLVAGQDLVRAELRMRRLEDRILGRLADLPSMKWVDVAGLFSTARFLPQDHDPPTGESAGPGSG